MNRIFSYPGPRAIYLMLLFLFTAGPAIAQSENAEGRAGIGTAAARCRRGGADAPTSFR